MLLVLTKVDVMIFRDKTDRQGTGFRRRNVFLCR